jgi:hypothetical protein
MMTYWSAFQALLSQLEHEDTLLLARTQWLVVGQALLFVAYVCIDRNRLSTNATVNLHQVTSVLGMLTTIFILASILASIKVFVEVRTDLFRLMTDHPDLPMRRLPQVGIGAGLLCPILLSLAVLFTWSLVSFASKWAAALMVISGVLFSVGVIGGAHEFPTESSQQLFQSGFLAAGLVLLLLAIVLGVRKKRPT